MPTESDAHAVPVIAYTVRAAVAVSGLSRSRVYELISRGEIDARKDGRKTLVVAESLHAYITTLPPYQFNGAQRRAKQRR